MTPERAAAIKLMEQAIQAMRDTTLLEHKDQPEILTGWATVCSYTRFDTAGGSTSVSVYMPDTMPSWQQLGMLRAGELLVEEDFVGPEVEES